jgi:hypothetical protein
VTVVLLIATEVILLALFRNNLTLNIIMLIHPVDWIKQWQMADRGRRPLAQPSDLNDASRRTVRREASPGEPHPLTIR